MTGFSLMSIFELIIYLTIYLDEMHFKKKHNLEYLDELDNWVDDDDATDDVISRYLELDNWPAHKVVIWEH